MALHGAAWRCVAVRGRGNVIVIVAVAVAEKSRAIVAAAMVAILDPIV
jgi:hypothetical protein